MKGNVLKYWQQIEDCNNAIRRIHSENWVGFVLPANRDITLRQAWQQYATAEIAQVRMLRDALRFGLEVGR